MGRLRVGALVVLAVLFAVGAGTNASVGRKLRVGLVLQLTSINDPFQHGAFAGLQRAVRELGVVGKVAVSRPTSPSSVPTFSYLARQRYDLIIALGFLEASDLDTAARAFPNSRFAIVDASVQDLKHRPRNVLGTQFRTEQAGYLAGYLAALMEDRRPGRHVIGSVGGIPIPGVNAYIAGYRAGAEKADPHIALLNGYSNDFADASKCRAIALEQIAAGAGVVFQVASSCGLGALDAARQKHVWGIGVDVDESFLGPHILTSVVKALGVSVFEIIKSLQHGRFHGGTDAIFDLANGGVGLGRISPQVPHSFLARLDRVRAEIIAGAIKVPSTIRR
jgi:basic membrane protein A